ncbi:MAG: hypothetical protein MH252_00250 [Thermosynechococcaceae cyanobacterium MS004]|nr:hypothetical protein [Thermosynechococcaceae cyanobacterium MS004]
MDSYQPIANGGAAGNREIEPSVSGGDPSEYVGDAEDYPGAAAFRDLVREGDSLTQKVRDSTESLRATNDWFQASNGRIERNLVELEAVLREDTDAGGDTGESNPTDEPVRLEQSEEPLFKEVPQTPQSVPTARRQPKPKQPERPKQSEQPEQRVEQQPEQQSEPKPVRDQTVDSHNPPRPSVDWER